MAHWGRPDWGHAGLLSLVAILHLSRRLWVDIDTPPSPSLLSTSLHPHLLLPKKMSPSGDFKKESGTARILGSGTSGECTYQKAKESKTPGRSKKRFPQPQRTVYTCKACWTHLHLLLLLSIFALCLRMLAHGPAPASETCLIAQVTSFTSFAYRNDSSFAAFGVTWS